MLHFTVIGVVLFLLYGLVGRDEAGAPRQIVVSEARIEALAEGFARTWLRQPTAEELRNLVEDYVVEEVYYREARMLGLDTDDIVIRRRLRQKMEFLSDDLGSTLEPTEAQLEAHFQEHLEKFVAPPRSTFVQLFLGEARGDAVRRDAEALLERLRAGPEEFNAEQLVDASLLPWRMESAYPEDIAAVFGGDFATWIGTATVGEWLGPIDSAFGTHVVRLQHREDGTVPELADVRPIVLHDWKIQKKRQMSDETLSRLLAQYEIRVEAPFDQLLMQP